EGEVGETSVQSRGRMDKNKLGINNLKDYPEEEYMVLDRFTLTSYLVPKIDVCAKCDAGMGDGIIINSPSRNQVT
ncbi:hypothetical protein NPIL_454331, partial [Nephila pilipes]